MVMWLVGVIGGMEFLKVRSFKLGWINKVVEPD